MTTKGAPRLAVIGCGTTVEFTLIPALRRIGWPPSVVIDASKERAKLIAWKFGRRGARITKCSNWTSVATEFDAALIALPDASLGLVTGLLDARKHAFIVAPLASTGDEWRAMIAAATHSGVILSVSSLGRYSQVARWTKELLRAGALGEIKSVDVRQGTDHWSEVSSKLRLGASDLGGREILSGAFGQTLDLLLWWFGELEPIHYSDDDEGGIASECVLEYRLSSGAEGRVEFSRTRRLRDSICIEGTRGSVEIHLYKKVVLGGSPTALNFRLDGNSAQKIRRQSLTTLVNAELSDFRASVSEGYQLGASGKNAAKLVKLVERCHAARRKLVYAWENYTGATLPSEAVVVPRLPSGSKVLITGATGFIGGRLVQRLIEETGADVRCIVRDLRRAARISRFPVQIIHADLSNRKAVNCAVEEVDYVFHCAYDVGSKHQNIMGAHNLIEACAAHSTRRLVHVSTFAVYEPFPDGRLSEETGDGDRSNIYVNTKLPFEKIFFEATHKLGVQSTIVQPSIVYGPFCGVWTNHPTEILLSGDVILPDCGKGLCNAVYVDDVVDGLILAAISPEAVGERFILSGPQPVTWAAFFAKIAEEIGAQPPQFWPYERIAKANDGVSQTVLWDPKRLIRAIGKSNAVRHLLRTVLKAIPDRLRDTIMTFYFDEGQRGRGISLPSRHLLAFYRSKAVADSGKARLRLGYQPHFDFHRGITLTGSYLRWAYETRLSRKRSFAVRRGTGF